MATAEQEKLYNEIIEYYSLTEQLIAALEAGQEKLDDENFTIVEDMVLCLEKHSDNLATTYIDYVRSGNAKNVLQSVRDSLGAISAKIEECRNRFLMLHNVLN